MPEECKGYVGPERRVNTMTKCVHSEDAARKAVKDVFAILGVDVDDPKQVKEFQEDLRFGERLRKLADKGLYGFVGALVTIAAASVWYAVTKNN